MLTRLNPTSENWAKLARYAWGALFVFVLIRAAVQPHRQTVYPIFAFAGDCWLSSEDCYSDDVREAKAAERGISLDQFRYAPAVAAFFAPLAMLPEVVGGTLWRVLNFGVFGFGILWLLHRVYYSQKPEMRSWQGLLWLSMLPLSLSSLNNSQANPLAVGLVAISTVAVLESRWNLAAFCLAAVTLFKIYPFAFGMLLMVLYPRQLIWRTALALVVVGMLPFAMQRPDFVLAEYASWLARLKGDDRTMMEFGEGYQDMHLLLRMAGVYIPRNAWLLVQAATGASLALLAWMARNRWPRERLLLALFDLCACWMMLFGPATESCTYIFLAPTLSMALVESMAGLTRRDSLVLTGTAFFWGFLRSMAIANAGNKHWTYWMLPIAALLLCIERIKSLVVERPSMAGEDQHHGISAHGRMDSPTSYGSAHDGQAAA
ncbi:MAG: glycosyltransferase family 87 protein [Gemmataceae bacterium]